MTITRTMTMNFGDVNDLLDKCEKMFDEWMNNRYDCRIHLSKREIADLLKEITEMSNARARIEERKQK